MMKKYIAEGPDVWLVNGADRKWVGRIDDAALVAGLLNFYQLCVDSAAGAGLEHLPDLVAEQVRTGLKKIFDEAVGR